MTSVTSDSERAHGMLQVTVMQIWLRFVSVSGCRIRADVYVSKCGPTGLVAPGDADKSQVQ